MIVPLFFFLLCPFGCGGDKGKETTTPVKAPVEIAGDTSDDNGGKTGDGQGGDDTSGIEEKIPPKPIVPSEGDPNDHFLGHGPLFAGSQSYTQGNLYVEPVIEVAPPGNTGKGTFKIVRTGKQMETAHFWKTRRAQKADLKVGTIALMLDRKNAQGIYSAPKTVKQSYGSRWWLARIVSVKALESGGYVWVASGYKVAADAIRILEGVDAPALDLGGDEDAHFIKPDHWVAGRSPIPQKGYVYVSLSAAVSPMDGGERRFVALNNGMIFDTAHAWQTRRAKDKDVKKGALVLVPDVKEGGIYRAPKTRKEALFNRWWFVRIEKKKKTSVMVEGGYEVAIEALRVMR
jgi:hypothetical protein